MLYSNWIRKHYQSVDRDELKNFISARLKVFYEEELDVSLVIFDDVLEHVLRIDNVLRHPLGHMLLAGDSGVFTHPPIYLCLYVFICCESADLYAFSSFLNESLHISLNLLKNADYRLARQC